METESTIAPAGHSPLTTDSFEKIETPVKDEENCNYNTEEFRSPAGIEMSHDESRRHQMRHFPGKTSSSIFNALPPESAQEYSDRIGSFSSPMATPEKSSEESSEVSGSPVEDEENCNFSPSAGIDMEDDDNRRHQMRHFAGKTGSSVFGELPPESAQEYSDRIGSFNSTMDTSAKSADDSFTEIEQENAVDAENP